MLGAGVCVSQPGWCGNGITIYNAYSEGRYLEVRAGTNDDCNQNPQVG